MTVIDFNFWLIYNSHLTQALKIRYPIESFYYICSIFIRILAFFSIYTPLAIFIWFFFSISTKNTTLFLFLANF